MTCGVPNRFSAMCIRWPMVLRIGFAEGRKTIREAGYVMTPEELKEYRESLFDEGGHFLPTVQSVKWVHKEKAPPEPEPLPIKRFLKVLAVALIGLAAALSLAVILAG